MFGTLPGHAAAQVLGLRNFVSRTLIFPSIFVLSAAMLFAPLAHAQSVTGSVSGTLVDSAGAVMAGVPVQLIDDISKQVRENSTNGAGVFQFTSMVPGTYTLKVANPGFKSCQRFVGWVSRLGQYRRI